MAVFLDVSTRLDRRSAEQALAEARNMWRATGDDIGKGMSGAINRALGAIDGSGYRKTLQDLRAEQLALANTAEEAHRRMARSIGDVETRTRRLSEVTAKYGDDSSRASAATVALADAHAIAARNTRDHELAAANAAAAHDKLGASMGRTATSMGAMAAVANGVGIASIIGLTTAVAGTTKMAADWQTNMTKLSAAADLPADQIKAVNDGILKMAGVVGYTAPQLAEAFYTIQKSQLQGANGAATAAEKLQVLSSASQLASIEGADLNVVVDGLTTSLNDFHIPLDQVATTASQVKVAVGDAKTNLQSFTGALHNIEPVAEIANNQMTQIYASMARFSQSGMSMDQGTQNLAQTMRNLMAPTGTMRDAFGKMGLSAEDLQTKLSDPNVGVIGVLRILSDTIRDHVGPNGKIAIDTMYRNADASAALKTAYDALNPSAKALADQLNNGTLTDFKGLRTAEKNDPALKQWDAMREKVNGLSSNLKKLQPDLETVQQAWKELTGGAETLNIAALLAGSPEAIKATDDELKKLNGTTADSGNKVQGFNESQETLNAKMRDAKAAFNAAGIELGTVFVPVMTEVANIAQTVGSYLEANPGMARLAAEAMIGLAGTWTAWKIASSDAAKAAVSGLTWVGEKLGLTTAAAAKTNLALADAGPSALRGAAGVQAAAQLEIAEEAAVAGAATRADGALAAGGGFASKAKGVLKTAGDLSLVGLAIDAVGDAGQWVQDQLKGIPGVDKAQALWHNVPGGGSGWADGGPVDGPGPRGRDSVRAWLAPGEHVLTAADVDAAGGHAGVYAWRNALHREVGGPSDIDAAILSNVPSGRYSNTGAADLTKGLADCSSAVEGLVHIMDGEAIPAMRQMSTGNEASWLTAHGFLPGMGGPGDFRVGFNDHHTQATLPGGTPFNWGSDAAAARGGVGGTGADDPAFTSHFYRPVSGVGGEQRLFVAQERVHKLEDRIAVLQQKISEETSKTKESEKIRLDDELKRAQEELSHAKDQLAEVERNPGGSRGYGRGGRGGSGGMQFGAPLPENMGLGKGIPGFFEWLTTFAADMAIGPIEGAMLGNYLRSGGDMSDLGLGGDAAGGFGDIAAAAGVPLTGLDSSLGGNYTPPAAGGSAGGSGSGGGAGGSSGSWWAPGAGKQSPGASGLWWAPGSAQRHTDMAGNAPAAPFSYKNPDGSYPPGFIGPMIIDPARGLSQGDIAGIHGDSMTPGTPMFPAMNPHIPPADAPLPPNRVPIPRNAAGGVDFDAIRRGLPQGPLDMTNRPFTVGQYKDVYPPHFAKGGPSGSDTIPAWLGPGEFVMNKTATEHNLDALQFMNAAHYDTGTSQPLQPGQGQQPAPKSSGPAQPQGKPGQPGQGQPHMGSGKMPGPGNLSIPGGSDTHPGLTTPGADTQQFGEGLPASSGIGFGGGLIGAAEQAAAGAASAAGAAGGGGGGAAAGMAMNMAFQMMNRTAGYMGQLGGIAAEGILSTLLPADSPLSNFSNTLPGKLIAGVAGVRPGQPNSAGKTEAPLKSKGLDERSRSGEGQNTGDTNHIGAQYNGPITVKADNPQAFQQQMTREYSGARAAYPTNLP